MFLKLLRETSGKKFLNKVNWRIGFTIYKTIRTICEIKLEILLNIFCILDANKNYFDNLRFNRILDEKLDYRLPFV